MNPECLISVIHDMRNVNEAVQKLHEDMDKAKEQCEKCCEWIT